MRIWKPTMTSIHGLLGANARGGRGPGVSTSQIQDAMLAVLRGARADLQSDLVLRIEAAPDPQALWYLRMELMTALAALQGETRARAMVEMLSGQFEGLLPRSLTPRAHRRLG